MKVEGASAEGISRLYIYIYIQIVRLSVLWPQNIMRHCVGGHTISETGLVMLSVLFVRCSIYLLLNDEQKRLSLAQCEYAFHAPGGAARSRRRSFFACASADCPGPPPCQAPHQQPLDAKLRTNKRPQLRRPGAGERGHRTCRRKRRRISKS